LRRTHDPNANSEPDRIEVTEGGNEIPCRITKDDELCQYGSDGRKKRVPCQHFSFSVLEPHESLVVNDPATAASYMNSGGEHKPILVVSLYPTGSGIYDSNENPKTDE